MVYISFAVSEFSGARPAYYGPFQTRNEAANFLKSHGWRPCGPQDNSWGWENLRDTWVKDGYSLKLTKEGHEVGETTVGHGLYITDQCPTLINGAKTPSDLVTECLYPEEANLKRVTSDWKESVSEEAKSRRLREAIEEATRKVTEELEKKFSRTERVIRQLEYQLERCPRPSGI